MSEVPADATRVYTDEDGYITSYDTESGALGICIPHCGKVKPNNQSKPGPIGNTQGIITPQTSPNASGPGNAAPAPEQPAEEEGWWSSWGSTALHTGLDVVGLIPVVGEVADGANALIYLAEGNKVDALLSAAAMLPIGGQAATAAKFGKKATQAAVEAAEKAAKEKLERELAEKAAREAEQKAAKEAEEKAAKEAEEKAAKEADSGAKGGNGDGGRVDGPKKQKKKSKERKLREPRQYEKKVENPDGSTTYTLKTKDGELFDVTYRDGYPDFSDYKYDGSVGKAEVKIDVTGNNATDFKRANEAAGFGSGKYSHPDGYTWHHDSPTGNMQLVRTDVHSATPHTGSASAARAGH